MPDAGDIVIAVEWIYAAAGFLAGLVIGAVLHRILSLRKERQHQQQLATLQHTFASLSSEALQQNNRSFLDLAEQSLQHYQQRARHEFAVKESEFSALIKPIREGLQITQAQIQRLEQQRLESQGALHQYLESLISSQKVLQGETRNLVQALRRPEVRGQWGELTLKRLVELAGMSEHCDFSTQVSTEGEKGLMRPDMVIHLPGRRDIVVDVKTPLDAYLSAADSTDDVAQQKYLQQHTNNVRQRVRELASKAYWQQFKKSPDFVILFIPGDQFLSAALNIDPDLMEKALGQKIILATPNSLVALLRAIAYGWRQDQLTENAEKIRDLGESLHTRLAGLTEHFSRLGKALESSVILFNKSVGSFESTVLPAARKFTDLGVNGKKEIVDILTITEPVRSGKKE